MLRKTVQKSQILLAVPSSLLLASQTTAKINIVDFLPTRVSCGNYTTYISPLRLSRFLGLAMTSLTTCAYWPH